jgi:hypothetical protein
VGLVCPVVRAVATKQSRGLDEALRLPASGAFLEPSVVYCTTTLVPPTDLDYGTGEFAPLHYGCCFEPFPIGPPVCPPLEVPAVLAWGIMRELCIL